MSDASRLTNDLPPRARDEQGDGKVQGSNAVAVSRRELMIGAVLAGAAGTSFLLRPDSRMPPIENELFESWVPENVGNWQQVAASGVVLPPPDVLRDRIYDNLVTRIYISPDSQPMMVLLAYNNVQDGVLQVHRPEVCYPVGGFNLSEPRAVKLDALDRSVPATMFTATGPSRTEQVLYFTRLGSAFPRSWVEQRLAVIDANVVGRVPDGILFRVSTISKDVDRSIESMSRFTKGFLAGSDPPLRRLLLTGGTEQDSGFSDR